MSRLRCFSVILFLLSAQPSSSQDQQRKAAPGDLSPDEIIKAFTAKESEFVDAWSHYSYRQVATVKVLSVNGTPTTEALTMIWQADFDARGAREINLIERSGRLRSVGWTSEDEDIITNLQACSITSKDLPEYELKYVGKERVDELQTYVFSVQPKNLKNEKFHFQGKIWVDDKDLQIVRTVGKVVRQSKTSAQFPEFETLRQLIDGKYWFPVWSHADSVLNFQSRRVHIDETVTYEDFKKQ